MSLNNAMDLINDNNIVNNISSKLGISEEQAKSSMGLAIPMILQGLNKNTNEKSGADSLASALEKNHDGSILNNIGGFFSGFSSSSGSSILDHIFGKKESNVENVISKSSGLNLAQAAMLMQILAPLVMGLLGKQKKEKGLNADDLNNLTTNFSDNIRSKSSKEMGFIEQFLDKDDDADESGMDDLMDMGKNLFKNFFS